MMISSVLYLHVIVFDMLSIERHEEINFRFISDMSRIEWTNGKRPAEILAWGQLFKGGLALTLG
jgi:hypothetical protein